MLPCKIRPSHVYLVFQYIFDILCFMKLRHVEKWTQGKPEIQALMSAFLVIHAKNLCSLIYHIGNNRQLSKAITIGDLDRWEALYSDWILRADGSLDLVENVKTIDQKAYADLRPLLNNLRRAKDAKDIDLMLVSRLLRKMLLNDFEVVQSEPEGSTNQLLKQCEPLLQSPQFIFALKVLIPCVLIYSTTPFVLLRWSLQGDIESLGKLFSLDSNLHNLPEIREIWEEESRYRKSHRYTSLVAAMSQTATARIKLRDVKIAIATLIEYVFKRTNHPISRREIRNLFDDYARDLGESLIDSDLPEGEEAFGRAINRQNRRWKEIDVTLSR